MHRHTMLQHKLFLVGRQDDHQDAVGPAVNTTHQQSIQQFNTSKGRKYNLTSPIIHMVTIDEEIVLQSGEVKFNRQVRDCGVPKNLTPVVF